MHIHRLYDFVVSVFVVHAAKVLLVYHKRYRRWLPIGGHIELDEDPEEALEREIREESGLKVRILSEKPALAQRGVKPLLLPSYMDVHPVKGDHKHIAFVYFAKSRATKIRLHDAEHQMYRWFSRGDLDLPEYRLYPSIRFYCLEAFRRAQWDGGKGQRTRQKR